MPGHCFSSCYFSGCYFSGCYFSGCYFRSQISSWP
ncbi:pentapeptide repeat-containing protein [Salinibacter ruber]